MTEKNKEEKSKNEVMTIKIDGNLAEDCSKNKKKKIRIFNNKKNNNACTQLLKTFQNEEKDLIMLPYPKKKENVNKTLNTIGNAHGISYPVYSVITGTSKGYLSIITDKDRKNGNEKPRKNKKNKFPKYVL